MAEGSKVSDWELRSKIVGSIPSHASNFSTCISKKSISHGNSNLQWLLFLNSVQHKHIIFAHFLSVVFYCSPVRAGCISSSGNRRLDSLFYKVIQLNCRDFSRILSNREICNNKQIRSFNSARIVTDTLMLHTLCTNPTNMLQTIRPMQHSVSFSRYPNKLAFHDLSRKCVGRNSFANGA